ncbi:MAG: hypothetical protein SGJ20_16465 [Planctomycetota bacterium]|nr:hypothetical protein [Planctomycetota bacterium]
MDPPPVESAALTIRKSLETATVGDGGPEVSTVATSFGTLKGQFIFEGPPQVRKLLNADKEQNICAPGGQMPQDNILLIGENGGIANVVIYAKKTKGKHESAIQPVNPEVVFDQKQCMFLSPVLAAQVGQTIRIKNSDPILHNTNISKTSFNQQIPVKGSLDFPVKSEVLTPIEVSCSIHPWMKAYMLFRKDSYFAVTDKDGKFEIPNLPADEEILFQVWHAKAPRGLPASSTVIKADDKGQFKVKLEKDQVLDVQQLKVAAPALVSG